MKKMSLSELCDIIIGKTPSRSISKYWGKGFKWVSISDMSENVIYETKEEITEEAIKACHCKKIAKGTLLLSFKLSIGKLAFAGTNLYTNEAIAALVIRDQNILNPQYLYHTLKATKFTGGNQAAKGITLNSNSLAALKIFIPSIENQNHISELLNMVEILISKRRESIQALEELTRSIFQAMFGDPTKMNQMNKIKFNEIITFITSGSRGWAKYYSETGDIFIRINNVKDAGFVLDDIKYVTPPINQEAVRTKTMTGDLLFSITADLGRTAIINKKLSGAYINQHLALIRLKHKRINPMYIAWYFTMPYGKSLVKKKNRKGVKAGLNFDDIRGLDIVLPPLPLQNKFADIAEKIESIKSKYSQNQSELENLFGSLSQQAFRGELNLNRIAVDETKWTSIALEEKPLISTAVDQQSSVNKYSIQELTKVINSFEHKEFNFESLMKTLQKTSYDETPRYDDIKNQIYKMLEGPNPQLSQTFNKDKKEIVLRANL